MRLIGHLIPVVITNFTRVNGMGWLAVDIPVEPCGSAIDRETICMPVALAGTADAPEIVEDACGLVAGTVRASAAVERVANIVIAVNVLHNVEFGDVWPVLVVATVVFAEGPECGPVAQSVLSVNIGKVDAGFDVHSLAFWSNPASLSLDAAGDPVSITVFGGDDHEVIVLDDDVVAAVTGVLDLCCAPIARSA